MSMLQRLFIVFLLCSSSSFASTIFVKDYYGLFYFINDTNIQEPSLYYGKVTREDSNQNWIEFDKMAEVVVEGCPLGYKTNLVCKINKFLEADRNNRASMVRVLVNRPFIFPVASMVVTSLD